MTSSTTRAPEVQYHVFLSFCGVDTGDDFTGLLNRALEGCNIKVFGGKKEIKEGDKIDKTILTAINNSKIYIPIIPQTYLNHKWCLIKLECMMNNVSSLKGQKMIFPIFYKVKPGDVEHRTPHLENPPSKVELTTFKEALAKVGPIMGWNVKDRQSLSEEIVDLVVQKVKEEMARMTRRRPSHGHLIKLDNLTQSLDNLLNHAIKRCTGRGSPSRENVERGRGPSRSTTEIARMQDLRMQDGSIGKGEIKGITSITTVEGLRMDCSEAREE